MARRWGRMGKRRGSRGRNGEDEEGEEEEEARVGVLFLERFDFVLRCRVRWMREWRGHLPCLPHL